MGLFDSIKEKAKEEARKQKRDFERLQERMNNMDMRDAVTFYRREFKTASSIMKKGALIRAYTRRIEAEESKDTLYYIFRELFDEYKYRKNAEAINAAQPIGRHLNEIGDSRVKEKEDNNGKCLYCPYDF